jgi:hypothetical protein
VIVINEDKLYYLIGEISKGMSIPQKWIKVTISIQFQASRKVIV